QQPLSVVDRIGRHVLAPGLGRPPVRVGRLPVPQASSQFTHGPILLTLGRPAAALPRRRSDRLRSWAGSHPTSLVDGETDLSAVDIQRLRTRWLASHLIRILVTVLVLVLVAVAAST